MSSLSKIPLHRPKIETRPFETMKSKDYFNVISTIAASALVVTSVSLAIYYGVHPAGNPVQLTANFGMKLPLLVTTTAGVGIALFLGVQIARKSVTHSWERALGQIVYSHESLQALVRKALHPNGRENSQTAAEYMEKNSGRIGELSIVADIVIFETEDQVTLRGIWHSQKNLNEAPTVLLFHGNGMVAEDMAPLGRYYVKKGFNVLLVEFRGYGMSEGTAGGSNQEREAVWDAEAALKWVKENGVDPDKILAHGYSLGGAYAAALGLYGGVKYIVMNHTFTSFGEVIENIARNITKSPLFTEGSTANVVDAAYFPIGKRKKEEKSEEEEPPRIKADGWNSRRKIEQMEECELFVIRGKEDGMMNLKFGDAFITARGYEGDKKEARLATIEGGHCDIFNFFEDEAAMDKMDQFLNECGLTNPRKNNLDGNDFDGFSDNELDDLD